MAEAISISLDVLQTRKAAVIKSGPMPGLMTLLISIHLMSGPHTVSSMYMYTDDSFGSGSHSRCSVQVLGKEPHASATTCHCRLFFYQRNRPGSCNGHSDCCLLTSSPEDQGDRKVILSVLRAPYLLAE